MLNGLLTDMRHALRLYGATPGSSALVVIIVAVAVAFVTAFLSLYVDLALKPYPGFNESRGFITLGQTDGSRRTGLSYSLIQRAAEEVGSLDAIAGVLSTRQPVEAGGVIDLEIVTPGYFEGFRPLLHFGRGFERSDHDAEADPVAVISYRFWQERFGGRPEILGTMLEMKLRPVMGRIGPDGMMQADDDTSEFRIVGVMSPDVRGMRNDTVSIWLPYERAMPIVVSGVDVREATLGFNLEAFARLRDGASADSAVRELDLRYDGDEELYRPNGYRFDAIDGLVRDIGVQRESKRQLRLFLAGSMLLSLVAAANVSLFLLARAPGRRRELGVRMAVGAPLLRLARQLATESALLVVGAAILGVALSIWLGNVLRGLAFLRQAHWREVSLLDWRVLALLGAFLLVLATIVSLAPVLGLRRLGISAASRNVSARPSLAQRIAGTTQIGIAGALGAAGIAFGWYLASMTFGYPGYEIADRHSFSFSIFRQDASGRTIGTAPRGETLRERDIIAALPGVSDVTISSLIPGEQTSLLTNPVADPGDPTREIEIASDSIDERYIEVLGLRLLHGRSPEAGETASAVVNQTLARRFFGRDDVVGEVLELPGITSHPQLRIVGVLADVSFAHPAADIVPLVLIKQAVGPFLRGIIESSLPSGELQQQLQELVDSGALELGSPNTRPLSYSRNNLIASDKARSLLTIGTAGLVVLLAAFGFYGTQRYLVAAGRREYAIRAALGAGPRSLGRLVLARGILMSIPGLAVGAALAFIVVAWLRDDFVSLDVSAGSVTVMVMAGLILLLLGASIGPARHARRTQPAPLLRED